MFHSMLSLAIIIQNRTKGKKGFPTVSVVKNLPAMQELQKTWIQSLNQEDPLKEGTETHSSILARRIPWTEEPGEPMGLQRVKPDCSN